MVIGYLFASLLGAFATVAFLSSSSWLLALLCAPFGGSALALMVGAVVAFTAREPDERSVLADISQFQTSQPAAPEMPSLETRDAA